MIPKAIQLKTTAKLLCGGLNSRFCRDPGVVSQGMRSKRLCPQQKHCRCKHHYMMMTTHAQAGSLEALNLHHKASMRCAGYAAHVRLSSC